MPIGVAPVKVGAMLVKMMFSLMVLSAMPVMVKLAISVISLSTLHAL